MKKISECINFEKELEEMLRGIEEYFKTSVSDLDSTCIMFPDDIFYEKKTNKIYVGGETKKEILSFDICIGTLDVKPPRFVISNFDDERYFLCFHIYIEISFHPKEYESDTYYFFSFFLDDENKERIYVKKSSLKCSIVSISEFHFNDMLERYEDDFMSKEDVEFVKKLQDGEFCNIMQLQNFIKRVKSKWMME